ncbi:MAG: alpha/beta hydrolase [Oscillospiraceae bacterium]|nr:alpha/beta hydrolase [Oscillospiraceae bacterium]
MDASKYPFDPEFEDLTETFAPLDEESNIKLQGIMNPLFSMEESTDDLFVEQKEFPGSDGNRIRALLYSPKTLTGPAPCLVYLHGGGFALPASPYQYSLAREYALEAGCRVLLVDYRLAPQHPFPAATEDCFSAYCWVLDHAEDLSVNPARVAVGGDSAGATLSTVICLMASDRHRPSPCGQMLIYPLVAVDLETESRKKYTDTPMCNTLALEAYLKYYIPDRSAGKWEYAAPLDAETLSCMPPSYIETAEFDCLHDEGILFAERLQSFKVPVELNNTKGTMHGFDTVLDSQIVRGCVRRRVAFLKSIFC